MEFNKMYQKVKFIVRKCEKEYYIQLWEKDDWEQEGQLTLFELYQKNPEIEANEELLYKYFKTKFRNHIKDKLRQQESDKRKINRMPYVEIGEISHRISSRKIYLDELVVLRDSLKRFKENLTIEEKEQYESLIANRRCLGKTKMKKKLENYLKDFKNSIWKALVNGDTLRFLKKSKKMKKDIDKGGWPWYTNIVVARERQRPLKTEQDEPMCRAL